MTLKRPFIFVRLAGGLGNQLFQFSASIKLAQRLCLPHSNIIIDTRALGSYETKRKYEIGFISNLYPGLHVPAQLPFLESYASRVRLAVLDRRIGPFELISSVEHLSKVLANGLRASSYVLDGYFQHPNIVFSDVDRKYVFTMLTSSKHYLIDKFLGNQRSMAIHIRRGDYITSKFAKMLFRSIPIEYYDAAYKTLWSGQKVFVFSDDSELSSYYASKIGGIDVRKLNLSLEDEFCLLMTCDDKIIANSTFSWWAAYLGGRSNKRVVCPKRWYKNNKLNSSNSLLLPFFKVIDI